LNLNAESQGTSQSTVNTNTNQQQEAQLLQPKSDTVVKLLTQMDPYWGLDLIHYWIPKPSHKIGCQKGHKAANKNAN